MTKNAHCHSSDDESDSDCEHRESKCKKHNHCDTECKSPRHKIKFGKDGRDGIDGKDGKNGRDGCDGQNGKDGENGRDGRDGRHGKDGAEGPPGPKGCDGCDGEDGNAGPTGPKGCDGKHGEIGPTGTAFTIDDKIYNTIPALIIPSAGSGGTVFTLGPGTYIIDYEMSLASAGSVAIYSGPNAALLSVDTNTISGSSTATTWIHGRAIKIVPVSLVIAISSVVGTAAVTTAGTNSLYMVRITILKVL